MQAHIAEVLADRLSFLAVRPATAATSAALKPPLALYLLTWACYLLGALFAGLATAFPLAAMLGAALLVLAAAGVTRAG